MPEVPAPRPADRDALIRRQQEEIARLRDALTRAEHERDRLKRWNERLEDQLDAARRAGFRQAAPFAKPHRQGTGRPPGRRAGPTYERHGTRFVPVRVDATLDAPLPAACPACGGVVHDSHIVSQYQEDLPVVRPSCASFASMWARVRRVVAASKAAIRCRPRMRSARPRCRSAPRPRPWS